ncbi:MAG: hypothetical protein PHW73_10155 [Atribacterota bacterium]|nr:hypothetical protein [Atribacterota bacterium]
MKPKFLVDRTKDTLGKVPDRKGMPRDSSTVDKRPRDYRIRPLKTYETQANME